MSGEEKTNKSPDDLLSDVMHRIGKVAYIIVKN